MSLSNYRGSRIFIGSVQGLGWFFGVIGLVVSLVTLNPGMAFLFIFLALLNHGVMAGVLAVFDIADDIRDQTTLMRNTKKRSENESAQISTGAQNLMSTGNIQAEDLRRFREASQK